MQEMLLVAAHQSYLTREMLYDKSVASNGTAVASVDVAVEFVDIKF